MSGAHRSTTASRAASARKSAAWLLQLAALATVLLAVLGLACLVGYLIVANPAVPGWLLPLGIVLLSAAWIWVLGDIAWSLRRERRRSPAFWLRIVAAYCRWCPAQSLCSRMRASRTGGRTARLSPC
jgi:protein-S-isoprenylcysteine O-methyltransferase Ste14